MDDEALTEVRLQEWLDSDTQENRAQVATLFARLRPENAFGVLQEILQVEEEKREKRSMVAYLALQIAIPALLFILLAAGWPIPVPVAFLLSLIGPPFVAARLYTATPTPPRERHTLERMAQLPDVRAIFPLLSARSRLRRSDPLRDSVEEALIRLLPRLTPETAHVLNSQFDYLWQSLGDSVILAARGRSRESPALDRAILRAFGNARPPLAHPVLTSVATASGEDPEAETLQQIAANYLAAWEAPGTKTAEPASGTEATPTTSVPPAGVETKARVQQVL